jgi:hypothetical protein
VEDVVKYEKELPAQAQAGSLLEVIARAVSDPRVDIEKMERLLAMQERVIADQRKAAYAAAMSRLAPKLPQIDRLGISHHGITYAQLEDIDTVIRPLYSAEGFALSFDSKKTDKGELRVIGKCTHAEGHSEIKEIELSIDQSGSKNGAQAIVSTISYGRRALTTMFFNLVTKKQDTDANVDEVITEDQAKDIRTMLVDMKSDEKIFLELIAGVNSIEQIPKRDYKRIMAALDAKRRVLESRVQ